MVRAPRAAVWSTLTTLDHRDSLLFYSLRAPQMADPLGSDKLLERARSLAGSTTSLSSALQALALVAHAIHSQLDFRLVSPTELSDDWLNKDSFKLKYRHDQSSLEFVVSIQDLNNRLLVAAAADADDANSRSSTLDVAVRDYFSPSAFPCPVGEVSDSKPFAASHRFKDLVVLYRLNIVQKLLPGLSKQGYSEVTSTEASRASGAVPSSSTAGQTPTAGRGPYLPDAGGPMGMYPRGPGGNSGAGGRGGDPSPAPPLPGPSPDDPLRIPGSGGRGGGPIADIGRRDLDPLGGMGGTFGGPSGFGRLPGMGGGNGGFGGLGGDNGGGMYMGPDHPLFRERFGPGADVAGRGNAGGRRWGGDGYLPPMGAPPGARFDPVGPSVSFTKSHIRPSRHRES